MVKVGAAGSFAVTAGGVYEAPDFPWTSWNTFGCGRRLRRRVLLGLLHGWDWERCLTQGNAVGAVVVSRHGCAPAIPTLAELSDFLWARNARTGS